MGHGALADMLLCRCSDFNYPAMLVVKFCSLLESEPGIKPPLRFRTDELLFVANDRLQAPNNDATMKQIEPALSAGFKTAFGGSRLVLTRVSANPKERFAVRIQAPQSAGVAEILARI